MCPWFLFESQSGIKGIFWFHQILNPLTLVKSSATAVVFFLLLLCLICVETLPLVFMYFCSALFAECCRYVDGVCGPTDRTSPGILKTGIRGRKLMGHWCITSNPRKTLVKTASKPHPEHRDLFKFYAWDAHTVTFPTFNVENLWFTYEWNKQKRDASSRITEQR